MTNTKICAHCGEPLIGSRAVSEVDHKSICNSCKNKEAINKIFAASGIDYKVSGAHKIFILRESKSNVAKDALAQLLYLGQYCIPYWQSKNFYLTGDSLSFAAKNTQGWYQIMIDYDPVVDAYKLSFYKVSPKEKVKQVEMVYFDDLVACINGFLFSQ